MAPHLNGFFRELEQFRSTHRLSYDLIHSHYWLSGMLGMWAQEAWKCPHVVMFHSLGAVKNHTRIGGPDPRSASPRRIALSKRGTLLAKAIDRVASWSAARSAAAIRQIVPEFAWPHIATAIIGEYGEILSLGNMMRS
jgi:D-inositol-3-phosphate glycosyltransferase